MTRSMKRVVSLSMLLVFIACGEEAEPNLPTVLVQNSSAECRDDNGINKLDYVEVAVLDFDGAEDLGDADVRVLSSILTMERESAVYDPGTDENGNSAGRACGAEGQECVVRYIWRRRSDSEQIFCDPATPLYVDFKVADVSGHEVNVILVAESPSE